MANDMKPMLFSVSYAGLWGQQTLDLKSFIAKAASLGYPAVELMGKRPHLSVLNVNESMLDELRRVAEDARIEIGTIAAYNDFTAGRQAREVPFVEMQIAYIGRLCRVGKALGAKIIRIFTGYCTAEDSYHDDWTTCVKAVTECAEVARDSGIVLGVQNHHDVAVSFDAYREFLDDVDHPNVKAMFDPWSPAIHGQDMRKCAREMAPRMVQTTLADYVKLGRFAYMPGLVNYRRQADMVRAVPLGDGFLDLEGFFDGLKEGGFSGYVAYEMCSPLRGGGDEKNLDETARTSLDRIRVLIE